MRITLPDTQAPLATSSDRDQVRLLVEDLASMLPVSDSVLCNFKRPFLRRMVAPVMDMLEMVLDFLCFDQNVGRCPNFESSQSSSPAGLKIAAVEANLSPLLLIRGNTTGLVQGL